VLGGIEELRLLVEHAATLRPHLTTRLEKAAFLVLLRPIQDLDGDVWRVGSEDGLRFYRVRRGECECSDYQRHGPGHPCKHRLALFLYRTLEEGATQPVPQRRDARGQQDRDALHGFAVQGKGGDGGGVSDGA
jgi:hypothetical protein